MSKKKKKSWERILIISTAVLTLIGVIIGAFISGHYSAQNQQELLEYQKQEFINENNIRKNNELRLELSNYIDNLSYVIFNQSNLNESKLDSVYQEMFSSGLKISLMSDINVGSSCMNLALDLQKNESNVNDTIREKLFKEWMFSIKGEMLQNDYLIDKSELKSDILQLIMTKQME